MVTIPAGLPDTEMVVPLRGAGVLRVTVPLMVRVRPTVGDDRLTVIDGTDTLIVAVPGRNPDAEAVTKVLPTLSADINAFAPDAFAGTVI